MLRSVNACGKHLLACILTLAAFLSLSSVHAQTYKTLYSFPFSGSNGYRPEAGVIADKVGNLYGTTAEGGAGAGVVFKLSPDGTETVLYSFKGGGDGSSPSAGLILDTNGNLYGTTVLGGNGGCSNNQGCGTVFKLAPDGTETILHVFGNSPDGATPVSPLISDAVGNLYGTTENGGTNGCSGYGCGTIFRIAPEGTEVVLYAFGQKKNDGAVPAAGLVSDGKGNLYGTTIGGGNANSGTIFKLSADGKERALHSFSPPGDGIYPIAPLIRDKAGNLYGAAQAGGGTGCGGGGCGIVFKLSRRGTETILHAFGGADGDSPYAGLTMDKAGNLYGTTYFGGNLSCNGVGCGVVFELSPLGAETVLHEFSAGGDGADPQGTLLLKGQHALYGTTCCGGTGGGGIVFSIAR